MSDEEEIEEVDNEQSEPSTDIFDCLNKVIDRQLGVIVSISDMDPTMYDRAEERRIMVIDRALLVILKAQSRLLKEILPKKTVSPLS
jgi:hypothetical protein